MERISRRGMLAGAAAAAGVMAAGPASAFMPVEGPDTPKLCLGVIVDDEMTEAGMRRYRQLGISHVMVGGGAFPWQESELKRRVAVLKSGGLSAGDIGMPWVGASGAYMRDIIYARPGRAAAIATVKQAIRAAGAAGIPVVEYNFYSHRLEEGYFDGPDPSRGGAVMESFHYDRVKDLPPLPEEGVHKADELWANLEYFLKEVVPVAEEANVRLSLHPNDPPAPISRGSQQVMATLADWKRLIALVDSPSNGITFDCGVTRELGEDPVAVCRYFAERDRIQHVHYRNVIVRTPRLDYTEVFPDNGMVDMFAVMKELVRNRYTRLIIPEHARGLNVNHVTEHVRDPSRERGARLAQDEDSNVNSHAAWAYHIAYARAMLQAALLDVRGA